MTFGKGSILLALAAGTLFGQSFQGGVRGRLQDQSGAAISTAKVTLTDTSTNISRSTLSSEQGELRLQCGQPVGLFADR